MPSILIYLGIMLAVIAVWFFLFRRPIYEAVLISFIILLIITRSITQVGTYIDVALNTPLLYSMTAFITMSIILTKTKIIDSAIAVILSLLGRISGGPGYVAVVASSFMGSLSGSGPGNVMATGSITIPAMKRSGFPRTCRKHRKQRKLSWEYDPTFREYCSSFWRFNGHDSLWRKFYYSGAILDCNVGLFLLVYIATTTYCIRFLQIL